MLESGVPSALRLSAMFACPDLPTALLVYKQKCTQETEAQIGRQKAAHIQSLAPMVCVGRRNPS